VLPAWVLPVVAALESWEEAKPSQAYGLAFFWVRAILSGNGLVPRSIPCASARSAVLLYRKRA